MFEALLRSVCIVHVGLAETRLNEEFGVWLTHHLKTARKEYNSSSLTQIDLHGNGMSTCLSSV